MKRKQRLFILIVAEPDGDRFYAYAPGITGLHADRNTHKEAIRNAGETVAAYFDSVIRRGDPMPRGCSQNPALAAPLSA
jgi:predicted RNase H-like HicB family nuclease